MQGMTYPQFKSWVLNESIRDAHYHGLRFAPIYALWWATTDRKPPADFAQLMEQIGSHAVRRIAANGESTLRPATNADGEFTEVGPSGFRIRKTPNLAPGTAVKSEYVLLANALVAFHAGDYAAAVAGFSALADRYEIEAGDMEVAMPYFALAAAKTGDKVGFEKFVEGVNGDASPYVWLSRAMFAAVRHEPDKAFAALQHANNLRTGTGTRPISSGYLLAEACEFVLREVPDARVRKMLVDWARAFQQMVPTDAWAYAVEADYAQDPVQVTRALAMTIYLDPASPRLAKFDARQIAAARAWLKANNPFLQEKVAPPKRVTQVYAPVP